jgi:hypothetical protein
MKIITNLGLPLVLLCSVLNMQSVLAQSKTDVFDGKTPITWLGLDYTQAKFIIPNSSEGDQTQVITTETIKSYIPAWNYLFLTEPKKFDVARATHRPSVDYALSVTEKVNNAINNELVSKNQDDFKTITEENIADLVKNYDYLGKTGIGMLIFIEGMDKDKTTEGAWVTFVDMGSKTMLCTIYLTGKTGGMGIRNNWADATFRILRKLEADKSWPKH